MDRESRVQSDLRARIPAAAARRWRGRCRPSSARPSALPRLLRRADRFAPNASLPIRCTRRVISTAARRENVISRMRRGSTPLAARCTTRWASVLVLPDPAPAITRRAGAASFADRDAVLAHTVLDSAALVGVELVEIGRGHRRIALLEAKQDEPCPVFVRNHRPNTPLSCRLDGSTGRSSNHRTLSGAKSQPYRSRGRTGFARSSRNALRVVV